MVLQLPISRNIEASLLSTLPQGISFGRTQQLPIGGPQAIACTPDVSRVGE
jgi:hypothetical protein